MAIEHWQTKAACSEDKDFVDFPKKTETKAIAYSKSVCLYCPVRRECLAYAVTERIDEGIWGGTETSQQRSLMLGILGVPSSTSWHDLVDNWLPG